MPADSALSLHVLLRKVGCALCLWYPTTATTTRLFGPDQFHLPYILAVYQGVYGPWSIEEEDEREVFLYRLGLNLAAGGV